MLGTIAEAPGVPERAAGVLGGIADRRGAVGRPVPRTIEISLAVTNGSNSFHLYWPSDGKQERPSTVLGELGAKRPSHRRQAAAAERLAAPRSTIDVPKKQLAPLRR